MGWSSRSSDGSSKVVEVLQELGIYERAKYIQNATTSEQKIIAIADVNIQEVPYFSMIVIPSQWQRYD